VQNEKVPRVQKATMVRHYASVSRDSDNQARMFDFFLGERGVQARRVRKLLTALVAEDLLAWWGREPLKVNKTNRFKDP
jgi:hypothetical protein